MKTGKVYFQINKLQISLYNIDLVKLELKIDYNNKCLTNK